ncbi:hypothetical protein TI39_contig300g00015 [Zymoseptoria brevis]|uniref:mRNA export factor GLE1 n=1 Tax=Zymoseptoria brevis TaxID=1047168 RepID=A0A0F4GVY5_9PEZI|nr:hypothetical protein TI39_contig300g00015 [Zymoseptoria brevis]
MESPLSKHYEDLSLQYVEQDRAFEMQLVEGTHRRESIQKQALESAAKAHKAIRDNAMLDLEMIAIEAERKRLRIEAEQNRLAEEAKRKLDEERAAELLRLQVEREKDEARQREAERIERERKEAEQRAAAQQQQREEQARKAREQKDKEAAEARAAQLEEQKLQEERKRQQTIQQQTSQPPRASHPPTAAAPTAVTSIASSSRDEIEKEHATFLTMKQALKQTRDRLDQAKNQDAWLKENLGERCRRRIKMLVNQVNKHNRDENRRKIAEIQAILDDAKGRYPTETVDISAFFHGGNPEPNQSPQFPLLLFDLLNHFAKAITNSMATEAAVDCSAAEPLGVMAASIFANPNYSFHGHSLIDILWARYHQRCPVLFGIVADERTKEGRAKMGWKQNGELDHFLLMKGLSAGYAAITLRDFSRSKMTNPAPNRLFWQSLSRILNVSATRRVPSHYNALEGLLDLAFIPRFISLYGQAAVAALRLAVREFATFPADRPATTKAAGIMEEGRKSSIRISNLQTGHYAQHSHVPRGTFGTSAQQPRAPLTKNVTTVTNASFGFGNAQIPTAPRVNMNGQNAPSRLPPATGANREILGFGNRNTSGNGGITRGFNTTQPHMPANAPTGRGVMPQIPGAGLQGGWWT